MPFVVALAEEETEKKRPTLLVKPKLTLVKDLLSLQKRNRGLQLLATIVVRQNNLNLCH